MRNLDNLHRNDGFRWIFQTCDSEYLPVLISADKNKGGWVWTHETGLTWDAHSLFIPVKHDTISSFFGISIIIWIF